MPYRVLASILCAGSLLAQDWALQAASPRPPAAHDAAMAFDAGRTHMVWFGGATSYAAWPPSVLAQTWVQDATGWSQRTPAATPPARQRHVMAYVPSLQAVVLFGGIDGNGSPLNDIWWYDGTNWQTQYSSNAPPGRADAAVLADGGITVFGGWSPTLGHLADLWSWSQWTGWSPGPITNAPPPRRGAAIARMTRPAPAPVYWETVTVLHGGRNDAQIFDDTWQLSYQWSQIPGTGGPARHGHSLATHPTRNQLFLTGGTSPTGPTQDLWRFDGTRWYVVPTATLPTAVVNPTVAMDPRDGSLLRVGGGVGSPANGVGDSVWRFQQPFGDVDYAGSWCTALPVTGELYAMPAARGATWQTWMYVNSGHFMQYAIFAVGFDDTDWNGVPLPMSLLPLGLPCQLRVDPVVTPMAPIQFGTFGSQCSYELPIPDVPALYGIELFAQGFLGDVAGIHVASRRARVVVW
ncbi:MAG: hypothetical protein JNK15_18200 [Planctomycetes bacterium]|nr:hypothetical protein [Planctomycetota bacterium]